MKIDLKRFEGTLPYASELFGVYQPLLGWKSKMTEDRFARGQESVFREVTERALARLRSNLEVEVTHGGFKVAPLHLLDVVGTTYVPRVAREIDSIIARVVANALPTSGPLTPQQWRQLLTDERLNAELRSSKDKVEGFFAQTLRKAKGIPSDVVDYVERRARQMLQELDLTTTETAKRILDREVSVSTYLRWLADRNPDILNALFYRKVTDPFADIVTYDRDPLASFGHNDLQAVLSPIGLVHLFRQYFFEFDTFLGPPVGHVWLSPGSSLELVEETIRRTLTERTIELERDTLERTEKADTVHDELSTAVREENRNNIKFGFGGSVNYDNGTTEAGAHTDLSLDNSRTSARETAHKQMREQSQKLTSEIRQSFKSTFKTVTETTATSSRRYVLQNATKELVNYELRRKMRQVGVQVQDIGTQLCWQVFVDDAGRGLGVAKLLHIAEPPDLASLHPPTKPTQLESKTVEVNIQFPYMRDTSSEGDGETDVLYIEGDDQEHVGGIHNIGYNDKIIYKKTYALSAPAPGYTLNDNIPAPRSEHSGTVDAQVTVVTKTPPEVEVVLHQVNFKDQPFVELHLTTVWDPDPAQQAALQKAYETELTAYTAEKSALERAAFLKAARERIKLASQIRKRPFEDLRDEERIAVYRRLIVQLMSVGASQKQDEHVTSELIRAIFDVDRMLYFVAPEWWRVRDHDQGHHLGLAAGKEIISANDIVTWEGTKAAGRPNNYFITEESDPAPSGSSLGWLLELDGDPLRNAFLNSPWVKAIIPIRPGKEEAALNWLTLAHVAGATGLDAAYDAPTAELDKITGGLAEMGVAAHDPVTLHDALLYLGHRIKLQYKEATTAKPSPFDPNKNVVPTETVYEHGFYPLQGSFEVNLDPTQVFSQWIEVLATDQVVALPYDAAAHL